ncbi:MAG: hypothetical protein GMKNLPBB_00085 [Myxococcota bacterium]|nr:hypothetical protein [Myxococcota bacterium]
MKPIIHLLAVCVILFSSTVWAAGGAPTQGGENEALKLVKDTSAKVKSILRRKAVPGTREHDKQKQDLTAAVNGFLDIDWLGRLALDKYWDERSDTERKDYLLVLREIIETSYTNRMGEHANYEETWGAPEAAPDNSVLVKSTIQVPVAGGTKKTTVRTNYLLRKGENHRWRVYDLIIEDVSLVRQYKQQFGRIIKKDGWASLISKMKSRLETLRKESAPSRKTN